MRPGRRAACWAARRWPARPRGRGTPAAARLHEQRRRHSGRERRELAKARGRPSFLLLGPAAAADPPSPPTAPTASGTQRPRGSTPARRRKSSPGALRGEDHLLRVACCGDGERRRGVRPRRRHAVTFRFLGGALPHGAAAAGRARLAAVRDELGTLRAGLHRAALLPYLGRREVRRRRAAQRRAFCGKRLDLAYRLLRHGIDISMAPSVPQATSNTHEGRAIMNPEARVAP